MATPLYNDRGQQIGYLDNNNQFHPIQRDGNANRVYKPQGGTYYNKNGSVNVTASEMNKPKSSAGMPSNVQNSAPTSGTAKSSAGMPTSAKQAQSAQQDKEAISKAHSDYNYNAAVAAKEAAKKNPVPPAPTSTETTSTDTGNTGNTGTTTNSSNATSKTTTSTSSGTAASKTATPTTPSAPAASAQNNYNLEQYDKYAASNLKKTLAKAGKLDQYQNFVNDFYGSSSMDNNRYDELMNKYGLGDTLKNNFYFGRANAADSFGYAGKNKTKQEAKQKAKAPNMEDVLKNASQYDMMQFMVGQGPIYEALKASSKY